MTYFFLFCSLLSLVYVTIVNCDVAVQVHQGCAVFSGLAFINHLALLASAFAVVFYWIVHAGLEGSYDNFKHQSIISPVELPLNILKLLKLTLLDQLMKSNVGKPES